MMDGIRMANQAADAAAGWQQYAATGAVYTAGVPGSATVVALRDTGAEINGAPVMDIDLTVTVPGREPYPVTHRQIVALAALANFQPGRVWPVKVDQQDPTKLVIG
jgi:hypothetical protein